MASNKQDDDMDEVNQLVEQYLKEGGTITKLEKYARSDEIEYTVGWGKKRKKVVDPDKK